MRESMNARRAVWAIAGLGTAVKLTIAATTFGTNDVHYWTDFARGAAAEGPLGIYAIDFDAALFNHGPLTAWFLLLAEWLHGLGAALPFLIRAPASLADAVSAIVLFEILRGVSPVRQS